MHVVETNGFFTVLNLTPKRIAKSLELWGFVICYLYAM